MIINWAFFVLSCNTIQTSDDKVEVEVSELFDRKKATTSIANRCDVTLFRCTNGDFYVALGSSMGLTLLVWVGGGLLERVLYFFGNEPSLGQKSDPAPASVT